MYDGVLADTDVLCNPQNEKSPQFFSGGFFEGEESVKG
jgi:hypothetical protein